MSLHISFRLTTAINATTLTTCLVRFGEVSGELTEQTRKVASSCLAAAEMICAERAETGSRGKCSRQCETE